MTRDRGSSSGELVILVPVMMMIVLLAFYVGRTTQTSAVLQHVADVAAREASMTTSRRASRVAIAASYRELARNEVHCSKAAIRVERVFVQGTKGVLVYLSCRTSAKDLSLLSHLQTTLHVESMSVFDRYRAE